MCIMITFFMLFKETRLLGRFAPIFYLNCEHVVFVYILKQKLKKVRGLYEQILWILKIYWKSNFVRGFHKKIRGFSKLKNFYKNKKTLKHNFF